MALSPMMKQYLQVKEDNKDCLIFFRLGDFYEMFFDDAVLVSRELELTLTGKECGLEKRAPMCGVPHHSADLYISRLVEKGYKVAICEQLEDPATAKGLVERGVVRIVTPGTVTDEMIAERDNSYILSICFKDGIFGAAYADISTGAFYTQQISEPARLTALIARTSPREVLYPEADEQTSKLINLPGQELYTTPYADWIFEYKNAKDDMLEHFNINSLGAFGLEKMDAAVCASGALIYYLSYTQKNSLAHIKKITPVSDEHVMAIDQYTQRNLELTETLREKKKNGSLLYLLDKTHTAMGSRLLKSCVLQPLNDKKRINMRLDAVDEIKNSLSKRADLSDALNDIYDMERLISRISYGSLDARGALSLKCSLEKLPSLIDVLSRCESELLKRQYAELDTMDDLYSLLDAAIDPKAPIGIMEGGIINTGFNDEVDKLKQAKENGGRWMRELEAREREKTGISKLKVGYNRVFGYYIEVTNSFKDKVPYTYIRKQTLTGSERYITEELKELEDTVLGAQDKLYKLEYDIFIGIRDRIAANTQRIQAAAKIVATCDFIYSLAQAAYDYNYCKPTINESGTINIKEGRHPVVERAVKGGFVPNDAYLDMKEDKLLVITGPNMAGKSTFMRQVGLIVIMAHIGSFVPAKTASICLTDRVFTRVGASDDLASGQSTFMVEMNELANILNNATSKSLLILDEIGRGTSTIDGLSIAWATIEYILKEGGVGAKTLFATHYHELIGLEKRLKGMVNYSVGVKEYGDSVIFLHRIKKGGTDRSFGIEVARLAGLPKELLDRAKQLMGAIQDNTELSLEDLDATTHEPPKERDYAELLRAIRSIDINTLTPLEALSVLDDIIKKAEE